MYTLLAFCKKRTRLDSNIESKSSNNTYLNIIEIFNKLFKKLNFIKSWNLVVTSTRKKGHIKFRGKIMSMTGKRKAVEFNSYLDWHHLQGCMKIATQISPLLYLF